MWLFGISERVILGFWPVETTPDGTGWHSETKKGIEHPARGSLRLLDSRHCLAKNF
jgi:hypothetical protein